MGLPGWPIGKESAYQCRRRERCTFNPWVRKIPWSRKWQPTLVFLPGKFHGQGNLVDCSPWGHKELDTTEHAQRQLLIRLDKNLSYFWGKSLLSILMFYIYIWCFSNLCWEYELFLPWYELWQMSTRDFQCFLPSALGCSLIHTRILINQLKTRTEPSADSVQNFLCSSLRCSIYPVNSSCIRWAPFGVLLWSTAFTLAPGSKLGKSHRSFTCFIAISHCCSGWSVVQCLKSIWSLLFSLFCKLNFFFFFWLHLWYVGS